MIKSITIINYRDESFTFTLRDPEQSGFFTESVDGLDPPPTTINSSPFSGDDGALFNSARVEPRNIVLTIGPMSGMFDTVENLRQKSYRMFPLKTIVKVRVYTDTDERFDTEGYVESNEVNIFSRMEKIQVSILCMDPYFFNGIDPSIAFEQANITPLFEFPFEGPLIEFSKETTGPRWITANNIGDVAVGAVFQVEFHKTTEGLTIISYDPTHSTILKMMYFQTFVPIWGHNNFLQGDILTISSVKGDKYAQLYRSSTDTWYDLLGRLLKTSNMQWIYMEPGQNDIRFNSNTGVDDLVARLWFSPKYQGV